MKRTRYTIPLTAAAALVLGVSSPAGAVVTVAGGTVTSDAAGDNFSVFCGGGGVLAATGTATTGDPCAGLTSLSVNLGDGTDTVTLAAVTAAAFPALSAVFVQADDGDVDTITGSPLKDSITAGSNDTVNGGDGSDLITSGGVVNAGSGDDTMFESGNGPVSGGTGDDRFVQTVPSNGIDGGDGVDSWEIDFDQVALAIGGDSIFTTSAAGVTISIPSAPVSQLFPGTSIEQLYLTMFKGEAQIYDGTAFPGASHVRGMDGPDDLRGGASDDSLFGGGANDTVTGNGGSDRLSGGEGNDTIQARDGVADNIDCGPGVDTAVVDAGDSVANCETVQLPPAPPAPPAVAPQTGKIKGPASVTQPAKAKFKFSSPTAGATFQCKLDKKKWKSCSSPHKVKSAKLEVGKHKLKVRAVANGLVDASPSKITFKVKKG